MEDEIRPPDQTIRDCLLPNYNTHVEYADEEDQLRRALEESETDYEFQFAVLESARIEKEREERTKHFAGFKAKIAQFMRIDAANCDFYAEILGYISKYESGEIVTVHVLDEDFYLKFRRTLDNMRLSAEIKIRLLELIQQ
jgi:hypothetical protein